MGKSICIIVRKPPYGSMDAAEAIRHMNGALSAGLDTRVVLMGDGVYVGATNQDAGSAGWTSLAEALEQALSSGAKLREGGHNRASAHAHAPSLAERGLAAERLVKGVQLVSDAEMAELLAQSESVLVF